MKRTMKQQIHYPMVTMKIAALILIVQFFADLIVCPHSKVEESFQLQATHDLIYFGIAPALQNISTTKTATTLLPYDHINFPGVVPRTFMGPAILATLCHILRWTILLPLRIDILDYPMIMQFIARGFLLLINAHGWIRLASTFEQKSKLQYSGTWFLLITASQFHMSFYASRMLPNVFALAFVLRCYTYWILEDVKLAAAILVFATAVFRCDLLLLLFTFGLSWLINRQLTLFAAIKIGILSGIISLVLTVPLDSILWQRLLWPEGEVFYFNTILGKSEEWGTSVWHWYFSSAIPKSMLATLLLIPFAITRTAEILVSWERRSRFQSTNQSSSLSPSSERPSFINRQWLRYFIPVIAFVILYSLLGHKEMRFIFPAIPGLNLIAAAGMSNLSKLAFPSKDKQATWIGRIAFGCGILCIAMTWLGNVTFLAVSTKNYPGGVALTNLSRYIHERSLHHKIPKDVVVHIDVASAMSGVSLFGQRDAQAQSGPRDNPDVNWSFKKSGYEKANAIGYADANDLTHLLSEQQDAPVGFRRIQTIQGKPALNIRERKVSTEDTIFIYERIGLDESSAEQIN